jgi:hypothetical protein
MRAVLPSYPAIGRKVADIDAERQGFGKDIEVTHICRNWKHSGQNHQAVVTIT